jgi:hypothetical protein
MHKVSDYREHAAECLEMSRRAADPDHKKQLLQMAEAWTMLADEREAQLSKVSDDEDDNFDSGRTSN